METAAIAIVAVPVIAVWLWRSFIRMGDQMWAEDAARERAIHEDQQ